MKSRKVIKWMNSSSNFDLNRFIHRLYKIELILSRLDCDEDERIDSIVRLHHLILNSSNKNKEYVTYSL
jgi:hypothetical protein